jgi:hypothetical protein
MRDVSAATDTLARLNAQLVQIQGAQPVSPTISTGTSIVPGTTVTAPEGKIANRGAINAYLGKLSDIESMAAWESSVGTDWTKSESAQKALFNAAKYLAQNQDITSDPAFAKDPYLHYLKFGKAEGRAASFTTRDQLMSLIGYDEARYLRLQPDVAEAVKKGQLNSGFQHFLTYGIDEGRRFASGGLFTGGMRLVGERGPELEVTGPARYWSFADTQNLIGGIAGQRDDEVTKELLRDMLAELKAIVRQNGYGTKAQLDKLDALESRMAGVERNGRMERISQ